MIFSIDLEEPPCEQDVSLVTAAVVRSGADYDAVESSAGTLLTTDPAAHGEEDWRPVLSSSLFHWASALGTPEMEPSEDLIPPTRAVLREALRLVSDLVSGRQPPPRTIVMDGDGGVVLKFPRGASELAVTILKDLSLDLDLYEDRRLVETYSLPNSG